MTNRIRLLGSGALMIVFAGCDSSRPSAPDGAVASGADAARGQPEFIQEVVVDYAGLTDSHAGPGPHPTTESSHFSLLFGGIRWFAGGDVEYVIAGTEPFAGANSQVVAGEQAFDALIGGRNFVNNQSTTQANPCTNQPSSITWAPIDGIGNVVGATQPCYSRFTKEIVGFRIILDSDDAWATGGAGGTFDPANLSAHEFGHAVGLGHVNSPRDGCLTMYRYVGTGETQKATLGWGDKLGLAVLYGNANTTAGACGS